MISKRIWMVLIAGLLFVGANVHASLLIPMYLTSGGKSIGMVKADDTIYGLLLTPKLRDLPPGIHGFHVHEFPLCEDHARAAGGHLDLSNVDQHRGPYEGNGHSGDLPVLIVNANGKAVLPVLAPRLKLEQIKGRSLVISAGKDNYSDYPEKNGGGGARMVCGEIPYH